MIQRLYLTLRLTKMRAVYEGFVTVLPVHGLWMCSNI